MGCIFFAGWSIVLTVAIGECSAWKWFWKWLAGDFSEMLGALSSEAVCGFAGLSDLGGLGIGELLFGSIFTINSNVLSWDFVSGALGSTVFGLLVISIPVDGIIFLLELVVGSSGRLGLALGSGADWTVTLTIVSNARTGKLASFRNCTCSGLSACCWVTLNLDGGGDS